MPRADLPRCLAWHLPGLRHRSFGVSLDYFACNSLDARGPCQDSTIPAIHTSRGRYALRTARTCV
jgi:hypothetical protein